METMKAISYHNYGSPDELQLEEVDKPIPKSNEVLVKLRATSVNSYDKDMLAGKAFVIRLLNGLRQPKTRVLGVDAVGTVVEQGSNVKDLQIGDEVFGDTSTCGFGCFAEYVAVPEHLLALRSPQMSIEQAATLPHAGVLMLQGMRMGKLKAGQHILINGAGGAIGTLGVQYAKHIGAEVTAVDHGSKLDMLLNLGADHVIDYTKKDYTATGNKYDMILDVVAYKTVAAYRRALNPGGRFIYVGGNMGRLLFSLMTRAKLLNATDSKKLLMLPHKPNRTDLEILNQLFEEKVLTPIIDRTYPLKDIEVAMRYFISGKMKGKLVMTI